MLTILHEIWKRHSANGDSNDGEAREDEGEEMQFHSSSLLDFKVVYIAPMKALASEVVSTFSKRLDCLGMIVKELTGDTQLSKTELMNTNMIVTTPEKWDVVTRKTSDVSIASIVR